MKKCIAGSDQRTSVTASGQATSVTHACTHINLQNKQQQEWMPPYLLNIAAGVLHQKVVLLADPGWRLKRQPRSRRIVHDKLVAAL
jgi:hypothetical protein